MNSSSAEPSMPVSFDDALSVFASLIVETLGEDALEKNRFLRDAEGRLTFVVLEESIGVELVRTRAAKDLGAYVADPPIATPDELFDPQIRDEFALQELVNLAIGTSSEEHWRRVPVIDHRMIGPDWARMVGEPIPNSPPVITFFSLKGGVGRSTAVAVTAANEARKGNNILVVDLDLEAPGVGGLLLDSNDMPEFGVLDWLIETNLISSAEGTEQLIERCVAPSPLTGGKGLVDVLPATGWKSLEKPWGVLPKLGRAFIDQPSENPGERPFVERIRNLIQLNCNRGAKSYDAVLIDARAGLSEAAAAAVTGLGAEVLCFGVDASQTVDGYQFLFAHLAGLYAGQAAMENPVDVDWRYRLRMVHAKARAGPEARRRFRDRMYEVIVNTLYEALPAGQQETEEFFTFDIEDEAGPHWPWPIAFDADFMEFDPTQQPDQLSGEFGKRAFEGFLDRVGQLIADQQFSGSKRA